MKNHIYLNSSIDSTKILRNSPEFLIKPYYDTDDLYKALQNEYGKIQTPDTDYHVLVGNIKNEYCPWCANKPVLCSFAENGYLKLYFLCGKCHARGPCLTVHGLPASKEIMDEYMLYVNQRYCKRIDWHFNFVNPYEGV